MKRIAWCVPLLLSIGLAGAADRKAKSDQPAAAEPAKPAAGAAAEPAQPDAGAAEPAKPDAGAARIPAQPEKRESEDLGMSILGNQEAPKALVIVPWKSSELGGSLGITPLLDDSRQPVDKEVFLRALSYYEIRESNAAQPATATPRRKS